MLEETNELEPRVSAVEEDIEEMETDEEEELVMVNSLLTVFIEYF